MDDAAASGTVDRFEALVRDYSRLVHSIVRRVGGGTAAQLGDDIEQRVFLEIWKQLSRERDIQYPSSYIYRAAVRETVRLLKQERRHRPAVEISDLHPAPIEESTSNPAELLGAKEASSQIAGALDELAPERRKAVEAHLSGFDVREIMRIHDWSYGRARNLVSRGMADLRQSLKERGVHV